MEKGFGGNKGHESFCEMILLSTLSFPSGEMQVATLNIPPPQLPQASL
jgi:hypothetical protein